MNKFLISKIKSKTLQDLLKVLSGNIIAQGIGFLTIIVISRDLGAEQYGVFSLLLAIFTISVQISDFGISTSYVKYVSENLSKLQEIFFTVIISKIILSFFVIFILCYFSQKLSIFFFNTINYTHILQFISIAIIFHSIFSVIIANFQAQQKFKEFALLNILHNFFKFLSVMMITILFLQKYHLIYFLYTFAFSVILVLMLLIIKYKHYIRFNNLKFNFKHFIEIYKLGFWIFLSSLIVILMMKLDLFMLQKLDSTESVGLFSVALTTNSIFILILSSLTNTLLPKVSSYLKNHSIDDYVKKLFTFRWYIIAFSILMIVLSPLFIGIVFGNSYEKSIIAFQILAISYFFSFYAAPLSLIIINKNKAYLLSVMNLLQLIIIFILNLLLIPKYGLYGASISISVMRIFGYFYVYIYVKRNYL